jgi:hypothetical protein
MLKNAGKIILLGATLFSCQLFALDRGRQLLISDTEHARSLLNVLENAVWAQDGKGSGKIAYVVYSTECGWSRKLFQDSRGLQGEIELRWIPVAARGADYVTEQRNTESIALTFQGQTGPLNAADIAKRAVNYNYSVLQSANYHFKPYANDRTFAYPTIMYQTANGLKVIAGNPADLNAMLAEVKSTPEKLAIQPAGVDIVKQDIQIEPRPGLKSYQNAGQTAIKVFGAPSAQAPVIDNLEPGYGIDATGLVAGTDWIEMLPYGPRGPRAYVEDKLMAKLSRLDFNVTPAGGNVVANKSLKILSHPAHDAPVLDTLEPGYQLNRVGTVALQGSNWDVVVVYNDGTRGYIAR